MNGDAQKARRNAIAEDMLAGVYYRLSALVSLDQSGGIIAISLFDTEFCSPPLPAPGAREIWLMSNHPEGDAALYARDRENLAQIRAAAETACVRIFVTNEDFICLEAVV